MEAAGDIPLLDLNIFNVEYQQFEQRLINSNNKDCLLENASVFSISTLFSMGGRSLKKPPILASSVTSTNVGISPKNF